MDKRTEAGIAAPKSRTTVEASWGRARLRISSPRAMAAFGLFALAALAYVASVAIKNLPDEQSSDTPAPTAATTMTAPTPSVPVLDASAAPTSTAPVATTKSITPTNVEQVSSRSYSVNDFSRRVDSKTDVRQIRQESTGDHSRNSVVL